MTGRNALLTKVRRRKDRANYDKQVTYDNIDEAFLANIAITIEDQSHIIPLLHVRVGSFHYLHGSVANRTLTHLAIDERACINITIVDGLLMRGKIPDHSMNYRSVSNYGCGATATDANEKIHIMKSAFSSQIPCTPTLKQL